MTTILKLSHFPLEFLHHLGIEQGGEVEVSKLPNGELRLRAKSSSGYYDRFAGCLKQETDVSLDIDELNQAITDAVVQAGSQGLK